MFVCLRSVLTSRGDRRQARASTVYVDLKRRMMPICLEERPEKDSSPMTKRKRRKDVDRGSEEVLCSKQALSIGYQRKKERPFRRRAFHQSDSKGENRFQEVLCQGKYVCPLVFLFLSSKLFFLSKSWISFFCSFSGKALPPPTVRMLLFCSFFLNG